MKAVYAALTKPNGPWITINELCDLIYGAGAIGKDQENHRKSVRLAVAALERDQPEGVRILRDGEGAPEKVRADLTNWTGRPLHNEPRQRDRRQNSPAGKESSASKDVAPAVPKISPVIAGESSNACPVCKWPMVWSYSSGRLVHEHNGADRHAAVGPYGERLKNT
jgi:hypothetical protein